MKKDTKAQQLVLRTELGNRIALNVAAAHDGLLHLEESFKAVGFHDAAHSISRYRTLAGVIQIDFEAYRGGTK